MTNGEWKKICTGEMEDPEAKGINLRNIFILEQPEHARYIKGRIKYKY